MRIPGKPQVRIGTDKKLDLPAIGDEPTVLALVTITGSSPNCNRHKKVHLEFPPISDVLP